MAMCPTSLWEIDFKVEKPRLGKIWIDTSTGLHANETNYMVGVGCL